MHLVLRRQWRVGIIGLTISRDCARSDGCLLLGEVRPDERFLDYIIRGDANVCLFVPVVGSLARATQLGYQYGAFIANWQCEHSIEPVLFTYPDVLYTKGLF